MDVNQILNNKANFHIIGVGGVSTSALAKYLIGVGKMVSGSDICPPEKLESLKRLGVKIYTRHSAKNLKGAQAVVYTSAVTENNVELKTAKKLGLPIIKRSELLGAISAKSKISIGVAGSHGKTTATAMLSNALFGAGLSPTCFIGGEDKILGNFAFGKGDICVYEACEYKGNFLDLKPTVPVVLNVDKDHLESYGNEENIIRAFKTYASGGLNIVNADDKNASKIINSLSVTFGIDNPANYTAYNLKQKNGAYSFSVRCGRVLGRINLKVKGKHNVYNALAAVAVADTLGVRFYKVKTALENFNGVGRRLENLGTIDGATCFADYAHHPKEILETLKVFNNPLVVFQPHTYSRTQLLMGEFISTLKNCNRLIVYKTYPARENYNELGSAKTLYDKLTSERTGIRAYAQTKEELFISLKKLITPSDSVVFFGAGDIYDIAVSLVKENGEFNG